MNTRLAEVLIGALAPGTEGGETKTRDGSRDFDFWMGAWRVHNRRLRERLRGSTAWDEFESAVVARPLLGGFGNEDVYRTGFAGGFTGMSFRFYDRSEHTWSIFWADSRRGTLDPPVVGGFSGDTGVFEGSDTFEGRPIRVRFTWSRVTSGSPRWEQAFSEDGGRTWETNWVMEMTRDTGVTTREFPIVELARYALQPGTRESFARIFDGYFPETFQQLGSIIFGQFLERGSDDAFTYLRGYPSLEARAEVKGDFYNGVLWKEHAAKVNDRLVSSDDVLLLSPFAPGRGLPVLPAVDLGAVGSGPRGVVVLQIFAAKPGAVEALARRAEDAFAGYRGAGAREAAVLATLDVPNNFPRHPIRTDGPYLVWVGVVRDEATLGRLTPLAEHAGRTLAADLRSAPELVVLDPTPRSRLRWTPEWRAAGAPTR